MVKALHRAGIEVILDVVFNHTAEGGADGPTFCWRGLDDDAYYLFEGEDCATYANFSGCGNTINANHAIVRRMILDSLHHWVADMHVDGFRFDLASILSRDSHGRPMTSPPVLWQIETDPVLAGTKLIAEAWDAGGLYQVGSFVGDRWREWNGRFRDDLRAFSRGDAGSVARLPNRLLASPDLYGRRRSEVDHSINFITAHDGFTLNDLVSYDRKHNEANGENNRDGSDWERSCNHGVEGPTDDPDIDRLRLRVIKSLLAALLPGCGVLHRPSKACWVPGQGPDGPGLTWASRLPPIPRSVIARLCEASDQSNCLRSIRLGRGSGSSTQPSTRPTNQTSWFDWSLVVTRVRLPRRRPPPRRFGPPRPPGTASFTSSRCLHAFGRMSTTPTTRDPVPLQPRPLTFHFRSG